MFPYYVFVFGGVMSGIGKGVITASIGALLKASGLKTSCMKIDPYLNVDAGTMNPTEHGEVFVTFDGLEVDQDIGNYERFLHQDISRLNYMTSGLVFKTIIDNERSFKYGGKCVEVVPHIPDEIIRRIKLAASKSKLDALIIEIGGTVGEYQNLLFVEAARMMKIQNPDNVAFILVSYLPTPPHIGEIKTKPTQYAVRTLNMAGIQPDFLFARAQYILDNKRKEKLSIFCNLKPRNIISAPDMESIYEVPLQLKKENLINIIMRHMKLKLKIRKNALENWENLVNKIHSKDFPKIKIGIVGKYFKSGRYTLSDSYISVIEAIKHACFNQNLTPEITWLDSDKYEQNLNKINELKQFDGIIVPGGFGSRGVIGKMLTIKFCRENFIPYLGLCYGMQLALIEFAQNVLKIKDANTTEVDPKTKNPIIDTMPEQKILLKEKRYGGSMRLGQYSCNLIKGTKAFNIYKSNKIFERHRHRYEFNNKYKKIFEKNGVVFSGINLERNLVEIMELKNHPFFIGTQFHPEFLSRPFNPHPLFMEFIKTANNLRK
jgi:CTP synthase